MTTRTRRRVLVSLVVLALTLPAESILLKAVTVPNVKDAAKQYVSSLSASQLQSAAATIQTFPYAYRRQIMAALSPEARVKVWQNHIANYVATHPNLDSNTTALFESVERLITPDLVSGATSAERVQVDAIVMEIQQTIGVSDARFLFRQLGPADSAVAVSEPLSEVLANYVRRTFEVLADADECSCSSDDDCGYQTRCSDANGCSPDESWPMCGSFWSEPCTASCKVSLMG